MVAIEALHLGAVVYVKDVEPMPGTDGRTKTRPGILLRKCLGEDDVFPVVIVKSIRSELESYEIKVPTKPDGSGPTSLSNPSAAVCSWVLDISISRVASRVGKCPVPVTAAIVVKVQELARIKADNALSSKTTTDAKTGDTKQPAAYGG